MKLHVIPHRYEYHVPFQISREKRTHQEALLIGLEYEGIIGWGELTSNAYYGVSCSVAQKQILEQRSLIQDLIPDHPQSLYPRWQSLFGQNSFIRCALDEASWDLYGKINEKSTSALLGLGATTKLTSCFTLGIGNTAKVLEGVIKNPWPIYKIKMGALVNVDLLEELRELTNAKIYIDANAAWSLADAIQMIPKIIQRGVSLIEQPLAVENNTSMKDLKGRFEIPFIADESFNDASDLSLCVANFDGINVKLQKAGGISPAKDIIDKAKRQGLKIMLGCMTESSVGLSAASQLVSLADFIDLDSMLLIKNDPASGLKLESNRITLSQLNGNGVYVDF